MSGGDAASAQLILFVAGDAPRSERARANLARALAELGADADVPREIDVLTEPGQTIEYGVFATPALLRGGDEPSVIYGDLSDAPRLKRFLSGVAGTPAE